MMVINQSFQYSFFRSCCVLLGLLFMQAGIAKVDPVDFSQHPHLESRYQLLIDRLRCPKCQNQSIGGSDAPISQDMRQKVYQLLKDGFSDQEIEAYMVERYGDFVTYAPPLKPRTWILWFGPPVFFLVIMSCFLVIRKQQSKNPS